MGRPSKYPEEFRREAVELSPRAPQRLVSTTQQLTSSHGVGVGLDTILSEAAVARRSLYHHFGGQEGLIAEALRDSAPKDEARYQAALESGDSDPRSRVLTVFDELDKTTSAAGSPPAGTSPRSCPSMTPHIRLTTSPVSTRERLHALFQRELTSLGHPEPGRAADQILVLLDGALVLGVIRPDSHPARTVRSLAEHILDNAPNRA